MPTSSESKPYKFFLFVLDVNFWVIPRRLVYIGGRFGTLCQVYLQRLDEL
jgi:hypothetical protein